MSDDYAPGYKPRPASEMPPAEDWVERARLFRDPTLTDARGRVVCAEAGHLVCTGEFCGGSCACVSAAEDFGGEPFIVRTDKDGDTLCKECRYETKAAGWNR